MTGPGRLMVGDLRQRCIALYVTHRFTIRQVAAELHVSYGVVRRALLEERLLRGCGRPRRLVGKDLDLALRLYREGVPTRKICAQLGGLHIRTLTQAVAAAGIPLRSRTP